MANNQASNLTAILDGPALDPPAGEPLPGFYGQLEEALIGRRAHRNFLTVAENSWQTSRHVDFCSGDNLALRSGADPRGVFLAELEQAECEISAFHGADAGLMLGSHEGFARSLAVGTAPFLHNDVEGFRTALDIIFDTYSLVRQGKRNVLVAVESIYSIDRDVRPLEMLLDVTSSVSSGIGNVSPVTAWGSSAVVVDSFGKAMDAMGGNLLGLFGLQYYVELYLGAIVPSNRVIPRSVVHDTSASYSLVAAIQCTVCSQKANNKRFISAFLLDAFCFSPYTTCGQLTFAAYYIVA
ncbi:hypothetical protein F5Y15DRAFT_428283 [Xylariaceae sp. FL0016]|nr:hypothetical protein F5Y15DRAFT_428283 [Xylariaceae sp. FL0016]